jgi:NADPH2:quinone reductase
MNAGLPDTMRAVVLSGPGGVDALKVQRMPVPAPREGWVLIRVRAVGLNRSELHTRLGLAEGVTFPRVLGIEATGEVVACPGGEFSIGQQVMTMMGGMGRTFDGGYAEYTSVPAGQVIAFRSELPWELVGAVPEMLQTAYGSLSTGLDAQPGQTLLVRGGTSSVGMATAVLAKRLGLTVVSTTRSAAKADRLRQIGVDHVIIDDGEVAPKLRQIMPGGVDLALELVGAPTLRDTLRTVKVHGVACFTGMLSNSWVVQDFYPIDYLPSGVRLTAYSGEAADLPSEVLQDYLAAAAQDHRLIPLDRVFPLDQIGAAHDYMEQNRATGKIVVVP